MKKIVMIFMAFSFLLIAVGCNKTDSTETTVTTNNGEINLPNLEVNKDLTTLEAIDFGKQKTAWESSTKKKLTYEANKEYLISFKVNSSKAGTFTFKLYNDTSNYICDTRGWGVVGTETFTYYFAPKIGTEAVVEFNYKCDEAVDNTLKLSGVSFKEIDSTKDYFYLMAGSDFQVAYPKTSNNNAELLRHNSTGSSMELFEKELNGAGKYIIRNVATGLVLSSLNATVSSSGKIVLSEDKNLPTQQWEFVDNGKNSQRLVNVGSSLAFDSSSNFDYCLVQKNVITTSDNVKQQWYLVDVDVKRIYGSNVSNDGYDVQTWQQNAVVFPKENDLIGTGYITLKWSNSNSSLFQKYGIIINGTLVTTVAATDDPVMSYTFYSNKVISYKWQVKGIKEDETSFNSKEATFYVTKKGGASDKLYGVDEMNLSWYYHWSLTPTYGTNLNYEFVPMQWGAPTDGRMDAMLAKPANGKYSVILGYNEPDASDQSNMSVATGISLWEKFVDKGLRTGSPATALFAGWSSGWFDPFMSGINNNVDFICVHFYTISTDVNWYSSEIQKLYNKYQKPIWITELGYANWPEPVNNDAAKTNAKNLLRGLMQAFDALECVERYAWFPFDPDGGNGQSGLYSHKTLELTELGRIYQQGGLPEGYLDAIS